MPWKIVERRLGRAGEIRQRTSRQRDWDRRHGEDAWAVGYVVQGIFVPQEEAFETVYCKSYEEHFDQHPDDLKELVQTAKVIRNAHAEATTGVDLQVPAVLAYLKRRGIELQGTEIVDIGPYSEQSHALSIRLSPLAVTVTGDPTTSLEKFWQSKQCLAVWEDDA